MSICVYRVFSGDGSTTEHPPRERYIFSIVASSRTADYIVPFGDTSRQKTFNEERKWMAVKTLAKDYADGPKHHIDWGLTLSYNIGRGSDAFPIEEFEDEALYEVIIRTEQAWANQMWEMIEGPSSRLEQEPEFGQEEYYLLIDEEGLIKALFKISDSAPDLARSEGRWKALTLEQSEALDGLRVVDVSHSFTTVFDFAQATQTLEDFPLFVLLGGNINPRPGLLDQVMCVINQRP